MKLYTKNQKLLVLIEDGRAGTLLSIYGRIYTNLYFFNFLIIPKIKNINLRLASNTGINP